MLRWINIFTTGISLTCLFLRQYYKRVWQNTFYYANKKIPIYYQYNDAIVGKYQS